MVKCRAEHTGCCCDICSSGSLERRQTGGRQAHATTCTQVYTPAQDAPCARGQTSSFLKCSVGPQGSKAVEGASWREKWGRGTVMHELGRHAAFPPRMPDVCQHPSRSEVALPQGQYGWSSVRGFCPQRHLTGPPGRTLVFRGSLGTVWGHRARRATDHSLLAG